MSVRVSLRLVRPYFGVDENQSAGVTQVLVFVSIDQDAILEELNTSFIISLMS